MAEFHMEITPLMVIDAMKMVPRLYVLHGPRCVSPMTMLEASDTILPPFSHRN